jgi:hypothetical protein
MFPARFVGELLFNITLAWPYFETFTVTLVSNFPQGCLIPDASICFYFPSTGPVTSTDIHIEFERDFVFVLLAIPLSHHLR